MKSICCKPEIMTFYEKRNVSFLANSAKEQENKDWSVLNFLEGNEISKQIE